MRNESAWVYLPDDEPDDSQLFGGIRYVLQPKTATEIAPHTSDPKLIKEYADRGAQIAPFGIPPAVVAAHLEKHLSQYGVTVLECALVNGRAAHAADQRRIDEAEKRYRDGTARWAETLLLDKAERDKPRKEAGLKPTPDTADEAKARKWLEKHKLLV